MKKNKILQEWIKILKENFQIEIIRRHRNATNGKYIEFISHSPLVKWVSGRQNMLKEAESCGYWVMIRKQTSPKKSYYKNHEVYQLFLTPVHPKKKFENKILAAVAMDFYPECTKRTIRARLQKVEKH